MVRVHHGDDGERRWRTRRRSSRPVGPDDAARLGPERPERRHGGDGDLRRRRERPIGGAGEDTFTVRDGASLAGVLDGGLGINTLDYSTRTSAVTANLTTGRAATALVRRVANLIGGAWRRHADRQRGLANIWSAGQAMSNGGLGNDIYRFNADVGAQTDTVSDSGGVDTLDFSAGALGVAVDLSVAGPQVVNGQLTLVLTSSVSIENVTGGGGSDTLTGNALANTLAGGPGDDVLNGGLGNDIYRFNADVGPQTDTVSDSGGVDTLDFSAGGLGVAVDLSTAGPQVVTGQLTLVLPVAQRSSRT
ncbi:MAG: M10 family metallopeptidase C-terminal domain-containing protein [Gemmataceae bacterium]